ncbi:MAG TPA: prephenate dehydratase domain-containing protein [Terriglobales bacterium]|nr:prephenate dehydratase domain-containing protein [Terriglobales bacterium]
MRIAIQGVRGCFSAQAAGDLDASAALVFCRDFASVQQSVLTGAADRGLLPIENTLAGEIPGNRALLAHPQVRVERESLLRIVLCLVVLPAVADVRQVSRVYSHPIAFLQCQRYLSKRGDWVQQPFFDTAGSVEHIMRLGLCEHAAVAGATAAAEYGARVADHGIGDRYDNFTRFAFFSLNA